IADDAAVHTSRRARGADAQLARVACLAAAGVAIVDSAVAVVVIAVANLGARLNVLVADDCAIRARRRASRADAQLARRAPDAAARVAVVHDCVTVVVISVARLSARLYVLIAEDSAVYARRRTRRADTKLARTARRATARISVVDDAVAIVVLSVAHLGASRH